MQDWSAESSGRKAIRRSEVIGALSVSLDITEGQPEGHARRSCLIGMRIGQEIGLPAGDLSDLFYALLLKDLGCSSNASKVCSLFGADDRKAKRELKLVDWSRVSRSIGYIARNVVPGGSILARAERFLRIARGGPAEARQMVQTRCERGAQIARQLQLSEQTALAIHALDEHWDGHGHPYGLEGDQIPLLARIMNLAQTVEVFIDQHGLEAGFDVAWDRTGSWFDPELVRAMRATKKDVEFWGSLIAGDSTELLRDAEPPDQIIAADEAALDRIAVAFSLVIDAKSPWTFKHSEGVAAISEGIAKELGCMPLKCQYIRRAALMHDLGKLGVSNLILDKPGKLDPAELAEMRKHPAYTQRILEKVEGFKDLAEVAAAHHERIDGKGYHRGIGGDQLPLAARILAVADMYEALAAKRPYRQDMSREEVMTILQKNAGAGICPEVLDALKTWLERSKFVPFKLAA